MQILIVDDDTHLLDPLSNYLERAGYKTAAVTSAEAALECLEENGYEIVIIDIVLPGMSGLEMTERVKKTHDVDVVLMTGHHTEHSYEKAIDSGASDFVIKPFRYSELLLRIKRVEKERELNRNHKRMVEKLKKQAVTDALTNLYNSRHFYKQLQIEVDRTCRYGPSLSLLFIDIDHFKLYNDRYGHLEGDNVLARLGEIIKSCLRKMDSAYRYGGEEFTVILPETGAADAQVVAERLRMAVEREPLYKAEKITVSIGVTEYLGKEPINDFIKRCDQAMYMAKELGRNRVFLLTQGVPHLHPSPNRAGQPFKT